MMVLRSLANVCILRFGPASRHYLYRSGRSGISQEGVASLDMGRYDYKVYIEV